MVRSPDWNQLEPAFYAIAKDVFDQNKRFGRAQYALGELALLP